VKAFPGLRVGHASDAGLKSGVTLILPDDPAVAAVHVAGGAPASRETDLLRPENTVERVDAVVLSGGSAFGLAAADGAMQWLAARGRGFAIGGLRVPIVPSASLFDLTNGGDKGAIKSGAGRSIYCDLGLAACEAAGGDIAEGSVGAGTGATTADLKGGFGAARTELPNGARVAAFVAANAVGGATLGSTRYFRAAPFERDGEFGGLGLPSPLPADAGAVMTKRPSTPLASTTLAVIVTDCALTRAEAKRVSIAAHDGIALAIFPAHTPFDGDMVFTLATGGRAGAVGPDGLMALSAAAAATLARAIARAVFHATPEPGDRLPAWRQRHGEMREA
jgi:L-aminopeptidase/D-esterase-like protein